MGIQLFQEQIPFSNKRLDRPISNDGVFTNPVIAPFSFDFTTHVNTLECVIYIRNDSQEHYYKNIVVSLMKEDDEVASGPAEGNIINHAINGPSFSLNSHIVPVGFSTEAIPAIPGDPGIQILSAYDNKYVPVYDFEQLTSKIINDYWIISQNATWDTIGEFFLKGPGGPLELVVGGTWNYNYRPTEISLTFTNDDIVRTWSLFDVSGNEIATATDVNSGTLVPIVYVDGGGDAYRLVCYSEGEVSDIVFYTNAVEDAREDKAAILSSDVNLSAKFSYGYDELNEPNWDDAKSVLVIPTLGNTAMPDTAYHAIRMRIIWKSRSPLVTVRDYFIDISYEAEVPLGA